MTRLTVLRRQDGFAGLKEPRGGISRPRGIETASPRISLTAAKRFTFGSRCRHRGARARALVATTSCPIAEEAVNRIIGISNSQLSSRVPFAANTSRARKGVRPLVKRLDWHSCRVVVHVCVQQLRHWPGRGEGGWKYGGAKARTFDRKMNNGKGARGREETPQHPRVNSSLRIARRAKGDAFRGDNEIRGARA
jgi:hypothetical protein